jgi:hypothetical protein
MLPMLKATILSAVLVFLPIAAHAEGSPRDIDLALGAISANGDYKKFVSDYARCQMLFGNSDCRKNILQPWQSRG